MEGVYRRVPNYPCGGSIEMNKNSAYLGGIIFFCALLLGLGTTAEAGVADTKHNLSSKTDATDQVCIFCHTPHNANPAVPLWNHTLSPEGTQYEFYTSPSSDAPQPDRILGSSKLCLSCHDGTVALGALGNPNKENYYNQRMGPECPSYIGCNLADDHPISIEIPVADTEVQAPDASSPVKLESVEGKQLIECSTCHDPHDNTYEPFLVMSQENQRGEGGQLCLVCHRKWGWEESAHATSQAVYLWDPVDVLNQTNPQEKTLAQWACQACHDNHGGSQVPLMNEAEEENCFRCHNGTIDTVPDIRGEFNKTYTHPIEISGVHFPQERLEDYQDMPLSQRHAECADCHEPHGVKSGTHRAGPEVPDSMLGTSGLEPVWNNGSTWAKPDSFKLVEDVVYEYQVCLKCHSSYSYGNNPPPSPSRVQVEGSGAAKQTPIDRDFNPANPSTHAVMGPSSNPNSTYGKFTGTDRDGNPWGWGSRVLCSDCHGNNDPSNPIQGPHGSNNLFILTAPYQRDYEGSFGKRTGDEGTKDHLCFRCHDYEFYAGSGDPNYVSGFSGSKGTNYHVWNERHKRAGCQACHSAVPHGWNRQGFLVKIGDPTPYGDGAKNKDLPQAAPGQYPCGRNVVCHP